MKKLLKFLKYTFIKVFIYFFLINPNLLSSYDLKTSSINPKIYVQTGHSKTINSISYSPDGKYVVSRERGILLRYCSIY